MPVSIYSKEVAHIFRALGEPYEIVRASHVEPLGQCSEVIQRKVKKLNPDADENSWIVDFSPIGLDTILGPYITREEALDEEHKYLQTLIHNNDLEL